MRGDIGNQCRGCRCADLVIDNTQCVALGSEAQHGFEKIIAISTIHPTGAQDDVAFGEVADDVFALLLGVAVDRLRVDVVVFNICVGLFAIKHIISGVVHQQGFILSCPLRHGGRCCGVDGECGLRIGLCFVHGGVRGWVDDDVGLMLIQCVGDGLLISEVELRTVKGDDVPERRERTGQLEADLSVHACDEDFGCVVHGVSHS